MRRWTIALGVLWAAAIVRGQATAPAKVEIDLSTPAAALQTYIQASKAIDAETLTKVVYIRALEKKGFAQIVQNYLLWEQYLERKAIAKFGADEGLTVLGHLRSIDDQNDMDIQRLRTANVQFSSDRKEASVFLRIERDRPGGLQTDRFHFLDRYDFVKGEDGWKLDFLKTYDCLDADKENTYRVELGVLPRMARTMKEIAEEIKSGKIASAGDAKQRVEDAWQKAYDDNTGGGTGGTQPPK